jgi:hypothetical protein
MYFEPLDLSSESGGELLNSIAPRASAELVAIAGHFSRVFSFASPYAPGLCCIGGEVLINAHPTEASGTLRMSVAGNGETPATALLSCLGEAAEYLSQVERPDDVQPKLQAGGQTNRVTGGWIGQSLPPDNRGRAQPGRRGSPCDPRALRAPCSRAVVAGRPSSKALRTGPRSHPGRSRVDRTTAPA